MPLVIAWQNVPWYFETQSFKTEVKSTTKAIRFSRFLPFGVFLWSAVVVRIGQETRTVGC